MAITPEDYFATLRVPILQGRDFNDRDTAAGAPVIIINQAMAKRYWPNGNPRWGTTSAWITFPTSRCARSSPWWATSA